MKKGFLLFFMLFLSFNVKALCINGKNNLIIEKGTSDKINLSVNVNDTISEVRFTMVYSSYDIPADFYVANGLIDGNPNGVSHRVILSNPTSGNIDLGSIIVRAVSNPSAKRGTITLYNAFALTKGGSKINLDGHVIDVSIGTPVMVSKEVNTVKNMLSSINSSLVNIELVDGVFEYSIDVSEKVDELDLVPVASDEKYVVSVGSQKISELVDGLIIISVSNGDVKEEYKIKVNKIVDNTDDKGDSDIKIDEIDKVEIDNTEFVSDNQYKIKWLIFMGIVSVLFFTGLALIKKK